jgi:hypothetical protein
MNKKLFFMVALLCTTAIKAQVRVGAAFGPALSLKGNNNDTAFFGKKYLNTQLRLGLHKGRLGLVFTGGFINQDAGDAPVRERLDSLPPGAAFSFTGGNVKNTFFTMGPEICFPLGPVKLHLHVSGGIGWINAPTTGITRGATPQQEVFYQNKLDKKTTGIFKTGINLNYYINKKIAVSLYSDYLSYSLQYNNTDKRNTANPNGTKTVTEHKQLAGFSGGLTYKF